MNWSNWSSTNSRQIYTFLRPNFFYRIAPWSKYVRQFFLDIFLLIFFFQFWNEKFYFRQRVMRKMATKKNSSTQSYITILSAILQMIRKFACYTNKYFLITKKSILLQKCHFFLLFSNTLSFIGLIPYQKTITFTNEVLKKIFSGNLFVTVVLFSWWLQMMLGCSSFFLLKGMNFRIGERGHMYAIASKKSWFKKEKLDKNLN